MAGWMSERWPMCLLPPSIRWQLADSLDIIIPTCFGYQRFASELRIRGHAIYTAQDIELIRVRYQARSPSYALLLDFEARGGSIQEVQRALEDIGHFGVDIIPAYVGARAQVKPYLGLYTCYNTAYPGPFNSSYHNTELPSSSEQSRRSRLNDSFYTLGSGSRSRIPNRRGRTESEYAATGTDQAADQRIRPADQQPAPRPVTVNDLGGAENSGRSRKSQQAALFRGNQLAYNKFIKNSAKTVKKIRIRNK